MVHTLLDFLGFVALALLEPKHLLRNLNDRERDEAISGHEISRWKAWLIFLEELEKLAIPRRLKPSNVRGFYFIF